MPVDDGISNPTDNRPFHDVLNASISRRKMMIGGLATAATTFFIAPNVADAAREGQKGPNPPKRPSPLLGFAHATNEPKNGAPDPNPSISSDYQYQVLIPWGTPLFAGVPELDPTNIAGNSAADQAMQVGIGHDGMWFFADNGSNERGVLCINHEFGRDTHVLGKDSPESLEEVRKSQHAHGMSVIELEKSKGKWGVVVGGAGNRNRRIHVNTPVSFSGPAAGSSLLETGSAPLGTVNNCANGYTPWGTYLTCEENFNGYFGTDEPFTATPAQARYGFSATGFGYDWHPFDRRFDLDDANNDQHRFGWVVEVDPQDPSSMPVKRTALGRFKHESVEIVEGKGGRIVAYMGDDERFDYIYKFVSAKNWKAMRAQGKSPLDEGTLYVARFNDDNTGDWLPLTTDNPALAGMSIDQILVYTRLAADAAGATPMDRPEWITTNPYGDVFCALTNNSNRVADPTSPFAPNAANPLAPNPDGHIIRWRDSQNHTGTTFEWDIFFLAKDSRPENGGDASFEFTDPDGLWADDEGRLFIQTDGGQPNGRNNQMVVADTFTNEFKRLFAGVASDEITGVAVTPDGETMFINSQHPGNGNPALTNFPVEGKGGPEVPRDATIVITKIGGGPIGS